MTEETRKPRKPTPRQIFGMFRGVISEEFGGRRYVVKPQDGAIFKTALEVGTFEGFTPAEVRVMFQEAVRWLHADGFNVSFRSVMNNLEEPGFKRPDRAKEDQVRVDYLERETARVVQSFEEAGLDEAGRGKES